VPVTPGPSAGPVLIGFAESLAAIETAWMLADAGHEVHAFGRRGRTPPIGRSGRVRMHEVTSPQVDAARTVDDLAALASRIGAVVVLPLDDDAVWICDRAASNRALVVGGPTGERARLALDKRRQIELASAAGFCVPPTVTVEPGDRPNVPGTAGPWIVKPALAVTTTGGRLARGRSSVEATPADVAARLHDVTEPMLVQPRLSGVGEGLFGYARQGAVHHWSAHRRIRMMNPRGSGSSACRSVDVDGDLLRPAGAFVAAAGWDGLFMIELLRADGTAWFMELNGRTWGSMVLARHRRLNYPAWAVAGATGAALTPPDDVARPHLVARHLGRELLHLAFVVRADRSHEEPDWPRVGPTVRSLLSWHRGDRFYNLRRGEAAVFLADTWQTLMSRTRTTKDAG
jgi:hypothetical protein